MPIQETQIEIVKKQKMMKTQNTSKSKLLNRRYKLVLLIVPLLVLLAVLVKLWRDSGISTKSYLIHEFNDKSEQLWEESVMRRHSAIQSSGLLTKKSLNPQDLNCWWDYFYPSYNCPYHLERIGRAGDGGKWVCGFSLFETKTSPCIVYSFGVAQETTFEMEIVNRTNCEIWAYDFSIDSMNISNTIDSSPIHFNKIGLGGETKGQFKTLKDLMTENEHSWIDILKIDIEEGEFVALNQIMETFQILPFGQLQIELHLSGQISFPSFYEWWERLESQGLRAVFMEPNNNNHHQTSRPEYMEYVFLNVKVNHLVMT